MNRSWSCEHCGRETQDAERACDYCGCAMCNLCTDVHDDSELCPSTAPVGTPTAAERDRQLKEALLWAKEHVHKFDAWPNLEGWDEAGRPDDSRLLDGAGLTPVYANALLRERERLALMLQTTDYGHSVLRLVLREMDERYKALLEDNKKLTEELRAWEKFHDQRLDGELS